MDIRETKKAVKFTNFSDETFVGVWNREPREYKPGKGEILPFYMADHFSKHLIDREITKLGKNTNNPDLRAEMLDKCIGNEVIDATSETDLEIKILNKKVKEKKEDKKEEKKEEEFQALNEIKKDEVTKSKTSKKGK